jgi:serine/threonine protein kinase
MPSENQVFLQLAKGLAHIHQMGFIHRDINPKNILIYERSDKKEVTIKWADFGLSKPVNERGTFTMSGVRGTFDWFAPEILDIYIRLEDSGSSTPPHRGTIKSDVFAEGLVFGYYLLGGQHPYGSHIQITQNILGNNPVNLIGKWN